MTEDTSIEWADHTQNFWIGCQKVTEGCDGCYAEADFDLRKHWVKWGPHGERRRTAESTWKLPFRWQRKAAEFFHTHGRRQRIFCSSLCDVFDNHRTVLPEWRAAPMPVSLLYANRRHQPKRVQAFMTWVAQVMQPHLMQ